MSLLLWQYLKLCTLILMSWLTLLDLQTLMVKSILFTAKVFKPTTKKEWRVSCFPLNERIIGIDQEKNKTFKHKSSGGHCCFNTFMIISQRCHMDSQVFSLTLILPSVLLYLNDVYSQTHIRCFAYSELHTLLFSKTAKLLDTILFVNRCHVCDSD